MNGVFERFAPFIRDYIYKNGWQELHDVQMQSADVIFNSDDNLLICSSTASGKTEAAFFPIISRLCEGRQERKGFSVLYIAPLKSLINDQFDRMSEILEMSEIPITHWHGDVGASHKTKALKNPSGILQITPESLESMLINRGNDIPMLFGALEYIIIDELHSLMGSDRGSQIMCQIIRLQRLLGIFPRRIGLSATIGDRESAAGWLGEGSQKMTAITTSDEENRRWRVAVNHFFVQNRKFEQKRRSESENPDKGIHKNANDCIIEIKDSAEMDLPCVKDKNAQADAGYEYIYDCCHNRSCIVFANSREETELITATLHQIAARRKEEDNFLIHHGNLSAALREDAEDKLKNGDKKYTVCATVTLELGIDIGRLERTVELDSPFRVSDFLQRMGRSGRRSEPSEMITVIREEEPLPNAPLPQVLPWSLLRVIAIIQLYAEERFIEPASERTIPLSLLFQQTLSLLLSCGEYTPSVLASKILTMPPFANVPHSVYKELLKFMLAENYLERTAEGGLIVGLNAEKLTESFKFYASFKDSEDYTVRSGSEEIGTISSCPPVGERFALAGRAWEIEETDIIRRLIYVKPIEGKLEVSWPGDYGEVHTKVLERMKKVLGEKIGYKYLRPNAQERLNEAVAVAKNTGCDKKMILPLGGHSYCVFPWLGTRSFRAMRRIIAKYAKPLGISGIENGGCYITFKMSGANENNFAGRIITLIERDGGVDPETLIGASELPIYDKYDSILPPVLLRKAYAADRLNVGEAVRRLYEMRDGQK